jgi:hypothetical protein
MRVLVCGGRHYRDREAVFGMLRELAEQHGWLTIINGGAGGADHLARLWAQDCYHGLVTIAADWHQHGTAAGPIRNEKMIVSGKPDMVLAFDGGKGTDDMCRRAEAHGIRLLKVES